MKISIVTPNYNYASYVGETIRSVVTQDYPEIEHIIVDDGSTDHSAEILKFWKEKYPDRIHLIFQKNSGQTPAINTGLRQVTGDIIGWVNSDDIFEPGTFKQVAAFFKAHPDADIVFGDALVVDESLNFMWRIRHLPFNYRMGAYLGFSRMVTSNAVFWRKATMDRSGLLREELKWNMDGEFYSRLMYRARTARIPIPLASFRLQPHAKSADVRPAWNAIQVKEVQLELEKSFSRLPEARWIPRSVRIFFKLFYKLQRIFSRVLRGHYLLRFLEVARYRNNSKSG